MIFVFCREFLDTVTLQICGTSRYSKSVCARIGTGLQKKNSSQSSKNLDYYEKHCIDWCCLWGLIANRSTSCPNLHSSSQDPEAEGAHTVSKPRLRFIISHPELNQAIPNKSNATYQNDTLTSTMPERWAVSNKPGRRPLKRLPAAKWTPNFSFFVEKISKLADGRPQLDFRRFRLPTLFDTTRRVVTWNTDKRNAARTLQNQSRTLSPPAAWNANQKKPRVKFEARLAFFRGLSFYWLPKLRFFLWLTKIMAIFVPVSALSWWFYH